MKLRLRGKSGISNQRGFWLRCFLGASIWIWVCFASGTALFGQVDIPRPERLRHVEGFIVSPVGHPVPNLEVSLLRDDKVAYQTKTDEAGEFEFEHVSGPFTFHVARSEFAAAKRDIFVTDEIVTALERKKLYVVLGPGACKDECSSVLTSKKDFDRIIRKNNKHGH